MGNIMGRKQKIDEKMLDVDASMQGTMVFKDPVNLRINGKFDGTLSTKGNLTIGQSAVVNADIEGDDITIAGTVIGSIKASKRLSLISPAVILGDIFTPILSISEGASLQGQCNMPQRNTDSQTSHTNTLTLDEVATYLEVKPSVIEDWASKGKIPAIRGNGGLRFEKAIVDEWVLREKVK